MGNELVKDWQRAGFSLDGVIPTEVTAAQTMPSEDMMMPRRLVQKIAILLKGHVEVREKRKEAAMRLFEGIAPANQNLRDTLRPVISQWLDVTEWFVDVVHEGDNQSPNTNPKELRKYFELFETTLGALLSGFFKTVEGLDEILEDANS